MVQLNKAAILELLKTEHETLHNALDWHYIIDDVSDLEELRETAIERIGEQDIVYYTNAIKYLADNDPSLTTSLELAHEMGYKTESLNSELLATLLYQQELNEMLGAFINAAEDIEELSDEGEAA